MAFKKELRLETLDGKKVYTNGGTKHCLEAPDKKNHINRLVRTDVDSRGFWKQKKKKAAELALGVRCAWVDNGSYEYFSISI